MKKDEWMLLYDVYFNHSSKEANFYVALSKEIVRRIGITTEYIYSENEEIPEIIGLKASISDLLIKTMVF